LSIQFNFGPIHSSINATLHETEIESHRFPPEPLFLQQIPT